MELAKDNRVFAKLGLEQLVQDPGGGGGVRFGTEGFRNHPVSLYGRWLVCLGEVSYILMTYLEDVDGHVPLTAVADGTDRQEVYQPVIDRFVSVLDGKLEVIVSLVQLIPEEQVGLCIKPRISSLPGQIGTLGP